MTEENIVHPYLGGLIEESRASTFPSKDRSTGQIVEDPAKPGQPLMVELPNRITVVYGKKKAQLSGPMVKALIELWNDNGYNGSSFRDWCEQCK